MQAQTTTFNLQIYEHVSSNSLNKLSYSKDIFQQRKFSPSEDTQRLKKIMSSTDESQRVYGILISGNQTHKKRTAIISISSNYNILQIKLLLDRKISKEKTK